MFNFIHRLTFCPIFCWNREVHRLRLPESLQTYVAWLPLWTEGFSHLEIQMQRVRILRYEVGQELKRLSVPTPGPKDATIG